MNPSDHYEATQRFMLAYRKMHLGALYASRVPNPYKHGMRFPELHRVDFVSTDKDLRECLEDAAMRFLNGGPSRRRRLITSSTDDVTHESLMFQIHLRSGVFFLVDPKVNDRAKVCYIPYGAQYPYASIRYDLMAYLPKFGTISSIR